jgi:hypothetical protein
MPSAEMLALSVAARAAVDDVLNDARREMTGHDTEPAPGPEETDGTID